MCNRQIMFKKNDILTIPNLLSLIRLVLLIPFFMALSAGNKFLAGLWAMLGIASDLLDGYLARKLDQCSDLGRMMDPLIDKMTALSAGMFLVLSEQYTLPVWFFICLLLREMVLITCSVIIIKKHKKVLESKRPGKISAFLVGLTLFLFIIKWQPAATYVMYASVIATVYSTWTYSQRFIHLLKKYQVSN